EGMFEREAQAGGAGEVKIAYLRFSGSAAMQDAILSGNVDVGAYGVPAMLIAWEKARGTPLQVMGIAGVTTTPLVLVTNRAEIKSLKDFTASDRIAMPALVSPQMYVLQMAAEREFGPGGHDRLRTMVVSLPHPDAVNGIRAGTEVTGYFSAAPFTQLLLGDARIHAVVNSEKVFGGPASFLVLGATRRFADPNPKLMASMATTMDAAARFIREKPERASEIYLAKEPSSAITKQIVLDALRDPQTGFGAEVYGIKAYADFMARLGQLKAPPLRWEDVFLPPLHGRKGT
ncbi:MAG: ABC transporter substrate-binding protein, partial [Proteobacteria bacterium]|nr:ABC transporter substrate-binding protein [Pseudomonadota bacterium]